MVHMRTPPIVTVLLLVLFVLLVTGMSVSAQEAIECPRGAGPTVDGTIGAREWRDGASVEVSIEGNDCVILFVHDGENLYVGFDIDEGHNTAIPDTRVYMDTGNDDAASPQDDDLQLYINPDNGGLRERQGNGGGWTEVDVSGWTGDWNETNTHWSTEYSISLRRPRETARWPRSASPSSSTGTRRPTRSGRGRRPRRPVHVGQHNLRELACPRKAPDRAAGRDACRRGCGLVERDPHRRGERRFGVGERHALPERGRGPARPMACCPASTSLSSLWRRPSSSSWLDGGDRGRGPPRGGRRGRVGPQPGIAAPEVVVVGDETVGATPGDRGHGMTSSGSGVAAG